MKRKVLSVFLSLAMVLTMIPAMTAVSYAEDSAPQKNTEYYDEKGKSHLHVCTCIDDTTECLDNGWYVAEGEINTDKNISVNGDVYLVLSDNCHLSVLSDNGITFNENASLTIYVQRNGNGELTANSNLSSDKGTFTINGGKISMNGAAFSNIIIYSAEVTSAGTIYGRENVSITGGTVTATGGNGSAGIGCGQDGVIEITDATVTAKGGADDGAGGTGGAGIGGGKDSPCGTINISGGTVTATGGGNAAGIGGGVSGKKKSSEKWC